MEKAPSRNRILGDILHVHKGIAIYQTGASPYWFARIRDPRSKRYVVRSTKTKSRLDPNQLPDLPGEEDWDRQYLSESESKDMVDVCFGMKINAVMNTQL